MFQSIKKQTAVNLITGSLGAGKTTLLKNLIKFKPKDENWAILVNEFGAIGLDGAILEQNLDITIAQIPGGCICCSAQGELKDAIETLLKSQNLDRLLIEPTGLGEPDVLVDLLQSPFFQERFNVQTVFAVLDAFSTGIKEIEQYTIYQNLLNMADVVILNKTDQTSPEQVQELENYANNLFPAKTSVISTNHAKIEHNYLNLGRQQSHQANTRQLNANINQSQPSKHHQSSSEFSQTEDFTIPSHVELPGLVARKTQNQLDTLSVGWIFNDSIEFDWTLIQEQFSHLSTLPKNQEPLRAKGIFKVGKPWMLFQWVNNQTSREIIAYRRDSRIELLLPNTTEFDFSQFEEMLKKAQK
ncbi:GTP-binding protein [Thiomicrorhabdus sp. Milos-T2]|uniref:CobW family GTP-binding protein n=1 Tax=Thiomicrorhabdus sp. Milos-T2 TaxID=90814 RepID=UPI000691F04B|nr:GTP-binding protein [Thiomicrorhabdus sp. Milos-T2]